MLREQGGQGTTVATLGHGGVFLARFPLLQGVRHTASVRAISPVDVLILGGADFTALATSSTHFSELLAGVMRQRLSGGNITEIAPVTGQEDRRS